METACLGIQFKPLIHKKTINNSKCCLVIVPEVSCIQNLDKFIWRQKTNLIEYMIPMTYKVVLQKWEAIQDYNDTTVKTYHSCVDLLLKSSNSMHGCLGSGDVTKIISDTLICKKCLDYCTSKEHSIHDIPDACKHATNDSIVPISHDTTHTILQLAEDLEKKQTKTLIMGNKVNAKTKKRKEFLNVDPYDKSLDKITNTENVYPIYGDTVQHKNVVMKTVTARGFIKHESTRWLSLSPICSVNTYETPYVSKIVSSKSVTCKIHESQRDLVLLGSISSPSDLSRDNQALSTLIDVTRQRSPKKLRLLCRTPPEMRVVEYVRFIEKEILPLKMWFNDIKRKCTALGIEFSKEPEKQCMTISTVSTSSGPEMAICAENTKSNRAVYKIVFDG